MAFKEVSIKDVRENLVGMVADEWMLVTAGDRGGFNTMTASWGFFGEMWGRECAVCVVRPSRYTHKFLEENEYFSLSFLGDNKKPHAVCGSKSGRDVDKIAATGLTPVFGDSTVYFDDARIAVICRKVYASDVTAAGFTDKEVLRGYGENDMHTVYVGEIVKVLERE